jgi:hypothetical protein
MSQLVANLGCRLFSTEKELRKSHRLFLRARRTPSDSKKGQICFKKLYKTRYCGIIINLWEEVFPNRMILLEILKQY